MWWFYKFEFAMRMFAAVFWLAVLSLFPLYWSGWGVPVIMGVIGYSVGKDTVLNIKAFIRERRSEKYVTEIL